MVIWHTLRSSNAALLRAARVVLGCALLAGCTSLEGPTANVDTWKSTWKDRASAVAGGAADGAEAVGDSLGTAYEGVREGFAEPDPEGFGAYPRGYAQIVRSHMIRFEGLSETAEFRFTRPVKSYSNKGILAGGQVDWQGYVVNAEVAAEGFAGQKRTKSYAVRMRDGEVIEVLDATYAGALKQAMPSVPAARAD